jgi:hypothetical protein
MKEKVLMALKWAIGSMSRFQIDVLGRVAEEGID